MKKPKKEKAKEKPMRTTEKLANEACFIKQCDKQVKLMLMFLHFSLTKYLLRPKWLLSRSFQVDHSRGAWLLLGFRGYWENYLLLWGVEIIKGCFDILIIFFCFIYYTFYLLTFSFCIFCSFIVVHQYDCFLVH